MEYNKLGGTSLKISRLCFGALTIGPLQSKLPLDEGAAVIRAAIDAGVNFIDTAQLYGTYPYIRQALADYAAAGGPAADIIIASKSYAYSYEEMRKSINQACQELARSHVDIFLMHEQSSRLTLKGHAAALKCLTDAKKAGVVRAIGVSTHNIEVVNAAALMEEIDVIHPLINIKGIGIGDGSAADMLKTICGAHAMGKGIYAMKALGGGHLTRMSAEAFGYLLQRPYITSIAVGMQTLQEVALNTAVFSGRSASRELWENVMARERSLLVEDWCAGCGKCVEKCPANALVLKNSRAAVDRGKCILCGYCGAACPDFCLKII